MLLFLSSCHAPALTRSAADPTAASWDQAAERIRRDNGFDALQHAQLREDLQRGRIGVARNRLPVDTDIRDVEDSHLIFAETGRLPQRAIDRGLAAYNAERQLLSERIVLHARKLGTQLGVDLKSDEERRISKLLQAPGAILNWVAVPNFLAAEL